LVKNNQNLLIKSFWSRLIVIRDILDDQFFRDLFLFSEESKSKFLLFLNYRNNITDISYNFYSFKSNGLSVSFKFFPFYRICFDYLLKMSFFPFVETNLDKFLLASRPLKLYCDIPVELNNILLKNIDKSYFFSFEVSNLMNSTAKIWLEKNFPLKIDLFSLNILYKYDIENYENLKSFYSVAFNFMLNGMVLN